MYIVYTRSCTPVPDPRLRPSRTITRTESVYERLSKDFRACIEISLTHATDMTLAADCTPKNSEKKYNSLQYICVKLWTIYYQLYYFYTQETRGASVHVTHTLVFFSNKRSPAIIDHDIHKLLGICCVLTDGDIIIQMNTSTHINMLYIDKTYIYKLRNSLYWVRFGLGWKFEDYDSYHGYMKKKKKKKISTHHSISRNFMKLILLQLFRCKVELKSNVHSKA